MKQKSTNRTPNLEKSRNSFTLIELLIVIAIITILSSQNF